MLKGKRETIETNIEYRLDSVTERGIALTVGASSGDVDFPADPSGLTAVGILLDDVEDLGGPYSRDGVTIANTLSRSQQLLRNVVAPSSVVSIAVKGKVLNNSTSGAISPGDRLYVAENGLISATQLGGAPQIAVAILGPDVDGYTLMEIDI